MKTDWCNSLLKMRDAQEELRRMQGAGSREQGAGSKALHAPCPLPPALSRREVLKLSPLVVAVLIENEVKRIRGEL